MKVDTKRFKECPCCEQWLSVDEVMGSEECRLEGLWLDEDDSSFSFILFTHLKENCNSTFAILTSEFDQFMDEKPAEKILFGTSVCELHCLDHDDKSECDQDCSLAAYRRLIIKMLERKKKSLSRRGHASNQMVLPGVITFFSKS